MENDELNIDDEPQFIDLTTEKYTQILAEAPVYFKKARVEARQVAEREEVVTTLADGTKETVNIAEPGDVIVTNPGGEKYVRKIEKFRARYEPTSQEGIFQAKGMVHIIKNPTGRAIEIMAPWGEKQVGDADCMIAAACDLEQPDGLGVSRYIIGCQEFLDTYAPVDNSADSENRF
ncbi:MAG: PGDYG domain-containing protein [Candidatus Saccharibacteria bacterium]